jgi:hypothetical protein
LAQEERLAAQLIAEKAAVRQPAYQHKRMGLSQKRNKRYAVCYSIEELHA